MSFVSSPPQDGLSELIVWGDVETRCRTPLGTTPSLSSLDAAAAAAATQSRKRARASEGVLANVD